MNPHVERIALPTKEQAREIVEPIRKALGQALQDAIADWPKLYEKVMHILSPRSQSSIIHDHIVHHAKRLLPPGNGIRSFKQRGIFTVAIENSADVRFKKLDDKLRSNNVRTRQSSRYSLQLRLEGFADLPRLTAGYVLDDLRMALSRAVITLQVGRVVHYHIPLIGDAGQQALEFPKPVTPPVAPSRIIRRRVRAKKTSEKSVENE